MAGLNAFLSERIPITGITLSRCCREKSNEAQRPPSSTEKRFSNHCGLGLLAEDRSKEQEDRLIIGSCDWTESGDPFHEEEYSKGGSYGFLTIHVQGARMWTIFYALFSIIPCHSLENWMISKGRMPTS